VGWWWWWWGGGGEKGLMLECLVLCHTHSLFIHSFIHSFIHGVSAFDHCEEKRREEKRGERIASLKEEVDIFIVF